VANAGNGKKFKVGISGSYGGMSLGDEAILRSIVDQFRSMPVEITVFSFNPKDTLARHKVERAVPVREMVREEILPEIQRLDLFILGGGGILFDGEADLFLREAIIAQEVGVPVMVYAVSAGPLKDRRTQQLVRDVLNRASIVSVRERRAFKLLEEIGVTRELSGGNRKRFRRTP
jgi:polysaccharide pyruvyl transferase WcaK-like protein